MDNVPPDRLDEPDCGNDQLNEDTNRNFNSENTKTLPSPERCDGAVKICDGSEELVTNRQTWTEHYSRERKEHVSTEHIKEINRAQGVDRQKTPFETLVAITTLSTVVDTHVIKTNPSFRNLRLTRASET